MGWTFGHRDFGISNEDFFAAEFGDGRQGGRGIVKLVGGSPCYAAYRAADGTIIGVVILTSHRRSEFNFGWKEMEEGQGPCESKCPKSILDLLTPLEGPGEPDTSARWAWDWRARCRASLAANASRKPLQVGAVLTFSYPVKFSSCEYSELQCTQAKPPRFAPVGVSSNWYRLHRETIASARIAYPVQGE